MELAVLTGVVIGSTIGVVLLSAKTAVVVATAIVVVRAFDR